MAHNGVIDAKNAIEFSNVSGIGMEIDESVVTVGQTVDLVSEFALAPVVDVVNRTLPSAIVVSIRFITAARDSSSIDGATKTAIHKPSSAHLLWSLAAPGLVKAVNPEQD